MAARFVDDLGQRVLGMAVIARQPLIRLRLFDRVEILALDILDQRDLERFGIVELADDDRDFVKPCPLRCAPPSFAGDDLITVLIRPHHDRLDQSPGGDRSRQFVQQRLVEMAARLFGMR